MAYFLHVHALLLFTADILLSFSEHPPLKLPAAGFVLDLENGPTDQSFDDYLEAIKKAINPGNQNEIHQSSTCTLNSVRQWNLDLTNLYNEVLGITNDFLQPGQNYSTVEPRYKPRDWQNLFAVPRFRYIEVLFYIFYYYWGKENR